MNNFHPMLLRQIRKTLGESPALSPELQALLERVSDTYVQADEDRALIERSLELSSQELTAINKGIEQKVQKRTEELHQEHTRFMASISSLSVGFMMCNSFDQITMMNPALQELLATSPVHGDAFTHPSRTDWTIDEVDGKLQPSSQLKAAIHYCRETGQKTELNNLTLNARTLRLYIAPILVSAETKGTDNLGVVVLVEDITEQVILERSKNEFFTIASHELRTPLTAIRGNADIIQRYFAPKIKNPGLDEIVSDIQESAVRLIGIVNDFLDVSALEQGKMRLEPRPFSLNDLLKELERDLRVICDAKGLALVLDPSLEKMPLVLADQSRIKQVLYNLVGNAVKFTEKGGITVSAHTAAKSVRIAISDTGKGMSPEDQQLLFHKFQQAGSSLLTRDTPKGTGLGLYISKLIVEHSGGMIGLDHSEIGRGSTFVFSLPLSDAK